MFNLKINTESDAFQEGNAGSEVARILRSIAARIEKESGPIMLTSWRVMDVNGNSVGQVGIDHKDDN